VLSATERSIINTQYKLGIMWYQPLPILILCSQCWLISQSKNSFITVLASNFVEESVKVRILKTKCRVYIAAIFYSLQN
jgi:hypothetical protein